MGRKRGSGEMVKERGRRWLGVKFGKEGSGARGGGRWKLEGGRWEEGDRRKEVE